MGWDIRQRDDGDWELTDGKSVDPPMLIGRGTTDADITFIALRNSAGTLVYISPNTAGTGVDVSTTRP